MARVAALDGSSVDVHPVPVLDRDGMPYELTLHVVRDGEPFGHVGERCGWFLAETTARLRAAIVSGSPESDAWPDARDRFPASTVERGLLGWAAEAGLEPELTWQQAERYLPRDRELFAFRRRDPDDLASEGELRCGVQTQTTWEGGQGASGGGGHWRLARRAVLDAWGEAGLGVRAVLTAPELAVFLDSLLAEAASLGCRYEAE